MVERKVRGALAPRVPLRHVTAAILRIECRPQRLLKRQPLPQGLQKLLVSRLPRCRREHEALRYYLALAPIEEYSAARDTLLHFHPAKRDDLQSGARALRAVQGAWLGSPLQQGNCFQGDALVGSVEAKCLYQVRCRQPDALALRTTRPVDARVGHDFEINATMRTLRHQLYK